LESDIKKLKADLQFSRQTEQELRVEAGRAALADRSARSELYQLKSDNENLQSKLESDIKKLKADLQFSRQTEQELRVEAGRAALADRSARSELYQLKSDNENLQSKECTESCKQRRRDLDNDVAQLRRDLRMREDQIRQMQSEAQSLRQYKDQMSEAEVLMSALSAMQDKAAHLENSLSAETRLKLDLFSALGDCRRQLEIATSQLSKREEELYSLKAKTVELMAVMPQPGSFMPPTSDGATSSMIYSPSFAVSRAESPGMASPDGSMMNSNLDPNAICYTPKGN
ncbi:PREDICTED: macoilin-1-like, partial [Priapulus caudatus]|uniref:Macoilin n=1 Tax=Priapulus caudatus TaxID=37621 RepID=A0ABM1F2E3_PRICU